MLEPPPLAEKIQAALPGLTKSERAVAAYLTANLHSLPFETAASIARKVRVSQMTVGRSLRALGYAGFSDLKQELNSSLAIQPWLIGDRYRRFSQGGPGADTYAGNLEREIKALIGAYEMIKGERWPALVELVARSDMVFVAGFQTVRGASADFASRLEYIRDGVRVLDGLNGTYAELFARNGGKACLVLVDIRRYARQSRLLARAAVKYGVPLVIMTDSFCGWARDYTDDVYPVATDTGLFWDSLVGLTALLNLLISDVIRVLDGHVERRMKGLQDLQSRFEAFQD
jgi:DNA-binding MurR/RpiR family transcriptional regulator